MLTVKRKGQVSWGAAFVWAALQVLKQRHILYVIVNPLFSSSFPRLLCFLNEENYSLQWNYTVVSSSEKDNRISSQGVIITCSPIMLSMQNVWWLFKPNDTISHKTGNSHFIIYWDYSVSFSLSLQKRLNEWKAES